MHPVVLIQRNASGDAFRYSRMGPKDVEEFRERGVAE